jgi:membrane protein YdbS with pleckstrin-like domain
MSGRAVPPRRLWWLAAGFGVWCSALVFLYALHAIGCVFAWSAGALRLTLVIVFVAHLLVIGWMWRNATIASPDPIYGKTGSFMHTAIVWTAIAAFIATVVTFGPPLFLATCI